MLPIRVSLYTTPTLDIERAWGKRGFVKLYQLIQNIKTTASSINRDLTLLALSLTTRKIIILNKTVTFNPKSPNPEYMIKNLSYFLDKIEHRSPHLCIYNAKKIKHIAWTFNVNNEQIGVVYTSKPYLKAEDALTKKNYKIHNTAIRENQFITTSIIEDEKPITVNDAKLLISVLPNITTRFYDLQSIMTSSSLSNILFKQNKNNKINILGENINTYENNLLAHAMYLKHMPRSTARMPYIIDNIMFHEKNKFLLDSKLSISEKLTIVHANMLNEHGEEQTGVLYNFIANSLKDYNRDLAAVEIAELRKTKIKAFEFMSDLLSIYAP